MMKTLHFNNILNKLKQYELFLLVFILFLPEYLFYPCFVITMVYIIFEWFKKKLYSFSFVWIVIAYLTVMAALNNNTQGLIGSAYLVYLVMYGSYVFSIMSPYRYMELQFYIAWSSLFNFFFNFITWEPSFAENIMDIVGTIIPLEYLPAYGHGYFRAYSTFGNPNLYAFILLIVLLVAFNQIQLQWTFKNYRLMMFYVGVFIINIYCLLITGTRSILPAFGLGIMTIVIIQRKWLLLKIILLAGTGFLIFILLKPEIFPRFFEVVEHSQIRFDIWERALALVKKDPWWGKGMFTYALTYNDAPDTHNIFIEILLCLGVVGSTLFIGYVLERLNALFKYASYLDYPLAIAVLVATVFYGIFDIPLFAIQPSILFVTIMCLPLRHKQA